MSTSNNNAGNSKGNNQHAENFKDQNKANYGGGGFLSNDQDVLEKQNGAGNSQYHQKDKEIYNNEKSSRNEHPSWNDSGKDDGKN